MSTNVRESISSALFGKARRGVLSLLFSRPDEWFYVREIVRFAGAGHGAVQRELSRLVGAGMITKVRRGNQVYYRANRDSPVFHELHGLITKTAGLAEVLREALLPLADQIEVAFVYRSQAAGTAGSTSDIDLLVVGKTDELKLHRAIRQAEERLARSVNYSFLSPSEFEVRRKEKGGFLDRILRGDKIALLGEC